MNPFSFSGFLAGITSLAMSGLVFFTNKTNRLNRCFAMYCLAVAIWGFGGSLIGITTDPAKAIVLWRITHVGVILIPVIFYHFVTIFLGLHRPKSLLVIYLTGLIFLIADFTPLFISEVRKVFGQFYYDSPPGILYSIFFLFFIGVVLASHIYLWQFAENTKQRMRKLQVRWFFLASIVGFSGGTTCFLPVFRIDVYPYGNFTVPLYPIIMTYAIVKYRLMDINVVITRTVVFSVVYALVLGLPLAGALAWQPKLEQWLGANWWVWLWVVCAALATVAHYTNLYFQAKAEERLLKAQRRYQATLLQASHGMTQIRDLKRLLDMIVHVITKAVGVKHAAIYLNDDKENAYLLSAYRYQAKVGALDRISKDDPLLIRWLKEEGEPLVLDEMKARFSDTAAANGHGQHQADFLSQLHGLNASVVVPSFMQDQLLGFLVLGEKRDGRIFTTEDLNVFSTLANQAALAIENARFFDELKMNEAFMIQSEKMASLGQLASGMAHEIHNPLAIISGESQLYLEQTRGKNPDIDKLLQSIIDECFRAADITRRILRFAKPGKAEFQPVDMKAVIEECLQLVGYQVRLEKFQRTVNVPADLPKVKGNQNQLQEVVLNLVLNACQAMGPEKGGKIEISAQPDGAEVEIHVVDNGPGIPNAKLSKVFDPFYTTKTTGTGLGLFVSLRIIRSHNGTMSVASTEGEGTNFTIRLPVFREAEAGAR